MINKIVEYFYPFKHDKELFILKNVPTEFSGLRRYVLYSGNGGKTFKKILAAHQPLFTHNQCVLEYNWSFERITFNAQNKSFSEYKDKFTCLQDIENYHKQEWEKYLKGKENVDRLRKEYLEKVNKNIK